MSNTPLLVFDRDGDAYAFSSRTQAEGWMESIDVLDGEYAAAFTVAGHIVKIARVEDGPVCLTVTDSHDELYLTRLLEAAAVRRGKPWPSEDASMIAAVLLRELWEHRWPKHPRWLSRRLHGDAPPFP